MTARRIQPTGNKRLSMHTRPFGAPCVATDSVQSYRTEAFAATKCRGGPAAGPESLR
jgi:hypothetical protein